MFQGFNLQHLSFLIFHSFFYQFIIIGNEGIIFMNLISDLLFVSNNLWAANEEHRWLNRNERQAKDKSKRLERKALAKNEPSFNSPGLWE